MKKILFKKRMVQFMNSECNNIENKRTVTETGGALEKNIGLKPKKRAGFTLIEMVIVVTIIGILSGIVALKYNGAQKIARENADYANASVIATASYLSRENGDEASVYTSPEKLKDGKYLDRVPKVQSKKGENFTIEAGTGDDDVVIKAGETVFYPREDKKAEEK